MFGRIVDWVLALLALVAIFVTGAWAVYSSENGAESLEKTLQTQATQVLRENGYDWAEVTLDGQHAVLSGQSPGDGAGKGAIETLSDSGVLGGAFAGPITALTDKVVAGAPISPYIWSVEKTRAGRFIFTGYAPDRATIEALIEDAEAMAPGEVENLLRVGNGQPRGDWFATAHMGLQELESFEYGKVDFIDSTLRIEGLALSPEYRSRIQNGLAGLDENFTFESDIRGAGLWSASLSAGMLTLDGTIASENERADILQLVQNNFEGPVVDQMTVRAHDHARWLSGVQAIMPHFLRFRSGFVTFAPEEEGYRVSGEATGSTLAFLREDTSGSLGFPVNIDVVSVEDDVAEIAGLDFSTDTLVACQAGFGAVLSANRVNFQSGSASIDRSSGSTLDKLMSVARRCEGLVFEIGGHTDSQGDRAANISLSRKRAQAVADYMTSRGIAVDQIDAIGFGPDVPIGPNDTANGRAANRRIEFKVVEGG